MIQLGRYVRDLVTGFIGVATGRSEWLYGCARVSVDGVDLKDGKPIEPHWYDEQRIEYADDGPPAFSPVHPLDSGKITASHHRPPRSRLRRLRIILRSAAPRLMHSTHRRQPDLDQLDTLRRETM